jgi:predicted transcriptional regulator
MRQKKNKIERLTRPNGTVCENLDELEAMMKEFYEDLYKSKGTIVIEEVLSNVPSKVTPAMNADLLETYTESEVNNALFQMFPTKAPGPDGFPAHFFRNTRICVAKILQRLLFNY